MTMNIKELDDLNLIGVYCIYCDCNGKKYIGSTTQSFLKRLGSHIASLKRGKHKNDYLQHAFNKYGEECFSVSILEVVEDKSKVLEREQHYLDTEKDLFNINPLASGTPNMSPETIVKRAATMRRKYANGEVVSKFHKGHTPWNKGLTSENTDYSYLKVKKTITPTLLDAQRKNGERIRNKEPKVEVYTESGDFLGVWRSSKDLEDWSLTEENDLPIKSRLPEESRGIPVKFLNSGNIKKMAKQNKPYKGLYYKLIKKEPNEFQQSIYYRHRD